MRAKAIVRIRIVTAGVLLIAVILIGRLYDLQVRKGEAYQEKGEQQYVHTVTELFDRGDIYFTSKNDELFAAATIEPGYVLAVNPKHIADPSKVYEALSAVVPLDREDFLVQANKKDRTYVEIKQKLDEATADKISALDLYGVQLYKTQWRAYGGDTLAARTIGFVGYSGDTLHGLYGLERYYDNVLLRDDKHLSVNFFAEIFGNVSDALYDVRPKEEGDVVTSIEPTVAQMLDRTLEDTKEKWGSKVTGGIIINPKDGSIYALSIAPSFNLNDRSGVGIDRFNNPLVESVYEMGSIIKPLTMAAGIDAGAVTPTSTYYDPGCRELDDFTFCNYDGRGRGTVPMQEVLNQSLNTGVAYVVEAMGKDRFRDYFTKLKLGSETGIDLPGEVHGLVNNLQSPRDIEYATASFGQGIAMTPIETVRALATLANGGTLITPHIAKEIRYENGETHEVSFPPGERVYSEETSETITRMLVTVVDEALAGGTVALPCYSVAAKTGTAQIADHDNGGYYGDKYLHSFFGYFPAYDPQFLIFLYTVEPQDVRYASQTLTEPFMSLVRFLINYYDIPPDR